MNVRATMEQLLSCTVEPVLTALVAIVLLLLFAVSRKSRRVWPPGPTPWPVLGNIPNIGTLPHRSISKLAKKFGPLMSLKLGRVDVLVASSPAMAEEFLKTHDRIWASRHATTGLNIMTYGAMDIAFSEYGPRWRFARRVFTAELFSPKRLSEFQQQRKQEMMSAINDTIQGCCEGTKAVRMDLAIRKMATNITTRMLMNRRLLCEEDHCYAMIKDTDDFQRTAKEYLRLLQVAIFYLGDFIPWWDRFDPQGLKKQMYAISKKYDKFLQSVLDDHKVKLEAAEDHPQSYANQTPVLQDIMDVLLTRPSDPDGKYFTEVEMKATILDVIVAGVDTNVGTIEWGLSEMLKNPQCLEKAQAEVDFVVGRDRLVEESDLPNLPYLSAIVKENFRLHPSAPFGLPHLSTEDCEIQGYKIPAKTRLVVNLYAIHRDPGVYDKATEFDPERFLGITKDVHGLDFDLIPFGSGRRICPGKGHALLVVQYALALFIQTCNWSLPGNLKPEQFDMEEVFGMTLSRLNPLQAVASPRLPEYVLLGGQN